MLDFYKSKMEDESLTQEERDTYATLYNRMAGQTDDEAKKLKAEIEEQRQRESDALGADEDCDGCKI